MSFQRELAWKYLDAVYKSSVTYQYARYALTLNYSMLPENVKHQSKRCLLDALGCAIGAWEAPGRPIMETVIKQVGGPAESTVFCSGMRTSALNASLINSFLVRFLDFNDQGGGAHNSDSISSILAVAEREKRNGKDLLTAIVVSYELGGRFRDSIVGSLKGHGWTSDIRAGLNMPPPIGKLMGLDEEQIANAIGLCMSHTLPLEILDAHREENVMAKNLRFGWSAHDAILSCMLAKEGFTGPVRVIEGDSGIRTVLLHGEMDIERLIDFSGWRTLKVTHKPLPLNASSQGHVYATLAIVKEQNLKPEDIEAVIVRAPKGEVEHTTALPKKYPRNAESADHSAHYANAVVIKERALGIEAFNDTSKFTDPIIEDLIERITVQVDSGLGHNAGSSEIITKDGRRFQKRVDVPPGKGNNPITDKELEEKLTGMASKYMGNDQIKKLIDACWNADKLDDVAALTKLMVFPGQRS